MVSHNETAVHACCRSLLFAAAHRPNQYLVNHAASRSHKRSSARSPSSQACPDEPSSSSANGAGPSHRRRCRWADGRPRTQLRSADLVRGHYLYANQLAAVDELVAALDAGSDTLVSPGTDARWTVEILLGILASQQNGHNRVDLPLPRNGS